MSATKDTAERYDPLRRYGFWRFLLALVVTVAGVITVYHATIYGIKAEISTKADRSVVESIDSRLIRIETILTERVATKAELQEVRDLLSGKLVAIEAKLNLIP